MILHCHLLPKKFFYHNTHRKIENLWIGTFFICAICTEWSFLKSFYRKQMFFWKWKDYQSESTVFEEMSDCGLEKESSREVACLSSGMISPCFCRKSSIFSFVSGTSKSLSIISKSVFIDRSSLSSCSFLCKSSFSFGSEESFSARLFIVLEIIQESSSKRTQPAFWWGLT